MESRDMQRRVCSVCGARAIEMTSDPVAMEYREATYTVDPGFEYERCAACGEDLIPASDLKALMIAAADMARAERGLLAPSEIVRMRLELGLTQSALERALGASSGVVVRWERGTVFQGAVADRLMRLLWAHPELVAEVTQPVVREARGPYKPRSRAKGE